MSSQNYHIFTILPALSRVIWQILVILRIHSISHSITAYPVQSLPEIPHPPHLKYHGLIIPLTRFWESPVH